MGTKNALQILEQLRQMPNVPEQTRQSLVMLCDVLNNADAYTPNEVHLANASLFALEQVLAGEFEQLGELYFNEGASWLDAATPRGYHSQRHGIAMTLRQVITGLSMKAAIEMASELMSKHKYPIYSPRVEAELCVADETLSKVHVYYVSSEPMDIDV